jgi:signal transduction histidine kinase
MVVDVEHLLRWSPNRDPELTSFRAQLRVGGRASCEIEVPVAGAAPRHLMLDGRAHGAVYVVVIRDVTERRQQEQELRHLRQLESTSFLAASMVHDFANVMTAVIGSAKLISKSTENERTTRLATEIVAAGERGTDLVRRGMRMLRRKPAPPERIDTGAALRDLRGLLELVVGPAVHVRMNLGQEVAHVLVDRERFDQALLNLAANARDAMPHGGQLTISTSDVSLPEVASSPPDSGTRRAFVAVTVTDTGEGMTPEVRERVFERFFTTKGGADRGDEARGTGLGLASVQSFVTQSGGCITVRSAPRAGTSIVMYFPRVASGHLVTLQGPEPEAPPGRETVVVIESDDHVRFVVRSVLSELGYGVIDAPSSELALRQAQLASRRVHLVLADVSVAGSSGRDVVARLAGQDGAPALLWMSGLPERALAEHGILDEPLLRKAFRPSDLAHRVREILDRHAARDVPYSMAQ